MKFLDRVDKIKKEKVMKRGIVAVAVAVGLMVFGGCASMVYFSSEGHVPDEAPSVSAVSIDDSIMSVDQPCFAATYTLPPKQLPSSSFSSFFSP